MFLPGLSHHVCHRGNDRTEIFQDDGDRTVFLVLLGRALRRGDVKMHGYSLMGNHYHALVTAPDEGALPLAMQRFGRGYVRYFNERYQRTGTLWEGRYHASLITDERHWLTCLKYIERNPVKARMVESPEDYPWSSYRHHAFGDANPLVTSHHLYESLGRTATPRQAEWRRTCGEALSPDDEALIRAALRSNGPLHRPGLHDPVLTYADTDGDVPLVPPT